MRYQYDIRRLGAPGVLAMVDDGTYARGAAYMESGRVMDVMFDESYTGLTATVRGTKKYHVQVGIDIWPDQPGQVVWLSSCTCPVGDWCKHAVAALLQIQVGASAGPQLLSARSGVAPNAQAPWELELEPYLHQTRAPRPEQRDFAELGVLVALTTTKATKTRPSRTQLTMQLVTRGIKGRWSKSGLDWAITDGRQYSYHYGRPAIDPKQQRALAELIDMYRQVQRVSAWQKPPSLLPVDYLGEQWFDMLQVVAEAGVALISDPSDGRSIELVSDYAALEMTIAQGGSQASGAYQLVPELLVPKPFSRDAQPFGRPAIGIMETLANGTLHLARLHEPLSAAAAESLGKAITIPADSWDAFTLNHLPRLKRHVAVRSLSATLTLPEAPRPVLEFTVRFHDTWNMTVEPMFRYGPVEQCRRYDMHSGLDRQLRDMPAEQQTLTDLMQTVPELPLWSSVPGGYTLDPVVVRSEYSSMITPYLDQAASVPQVEVRYDGLIPDIREIDDAPTVQLSVTAPDGDAGDWFDLAIAVQVGGEDVPIAELIAVLTRGDDALFLPSGAWFSLDKPEFEELKQLLAEAQSMRDPQRDTYRITPLQVSFWDELLALGVVTEQAEQWEQQVTGLLQLCDDSRRPVPAAVPASLQADLRQYQQTGYEWLTTLAQCGLGGILADDMGLGKTVQMLALITRLHESGEHGPALVVAPTSVVSNWKREAQRFAPHLNVVVVQETERKAGETLAARISTADVVITSYAILRLDELAFADMPWGVMVLDEAQFVKNHTSKTYKAVRRMSADIRFAVTGTPMENSLMDLWSMLSIAVPGLYPDPMKFRAQYVKPIESGQRPDLLEQLRRRIRPFMLRRTKELVAQDLPPKQEQVLMVDLHAKHRALYDKHFQRERQRILGLVDNFEDNRIAVFRALTTLRQLALDASLVRGDGDTAVIPSAKVDVLIESLVEIAKEGHRALVFSQFTGFLAVVKDRLDALGIDYVYLDGRTRNREQRVEKFRQGSQSAFLISLKAGGFGLTLTEADYVFVLDPWWNPAAENQAVDRAHRIGQTRPVHVFRMVSTGTIEEKVVALQEKKRELFASVVDGGGAISGAITADDVRGLLG